MRIDRRLTFFLLSYGSLLLVPIWQLSLIESTEARYAEIAREMLASGNFLEPTLNGIFHFHKPPLSYWGMAAGMAIFGVNDFGVRFFGIVAAVLSLYFLHRTARLFFNESAQAFAVILVLASAPLFIAISRVVSTDIYLTCCVLGGHFFLFRQIHGVKSTVNAAGYGLLLGLGFMVKGPVIFLFTLVPQLVSKFVDPHHRRLFPFRDILCGLGCFFIMVLPWYVAVILRHPDLLDYFTKIQTVDRFATERFHRNRPIWYFLYLFPATFLPYSIPLLRSLWRVREYPPRMKALLFYVLLPLLVFCFSKSKLPPYIMPFYGTAALLVVYSFREFHSNWDDRITFAILLLLAAGIGITGFVWPPLEHLRWPLACAGLVALLVCLASYRLRAKDWGQRAAPLLMLGISVVAYLTLPSLQDEMKGYRPMAMKMNEHDPQRQVPTVIYKGFLPSISFYRQELAVMALGRARETMFEGNDQYRQWHVETDAELQEKVAPLPRVFVVSEPHDIGAFSASTSFACNVLLAQKRYTAYDCSSGSAETTPAAR